MRRPPLPARDHAFPVWFELGQRCSRYNYERDVAMRQMPVGAVEVIGQVGAAFATLFPARTEHEMINDQLTASVEKIGQRLFAVGSVKDVLLVDLDHRQLAPRRAKRISLAIEFLFSRQ